nr:MAG TPA: hypothetical protein [Bacteriophage sp.]
MNLNSNIQLLCTNLMLNYLNRSENNFISSEYFQI